jgi:hypothetical protein
VSHLWRSRCSRESFNGVRLKFTGRSGEAPDCPVNQRSTAPTVGREHRTVRCAPDSVRCANGSISATVDCSIFGRQSASDYEQCLSGGAPDCPMHHPTEGKNCLPRLLPTAPSCLGAIKGTPRRMEETPKHSLIISKHQDSILAHLIHCDSDLSSS